MSPISVVTLNKQRQLDDEMARLGIRAEDLCEQFIRSSGPGGQNVNKTATCVLLQHLPSGIEVKCQLSRSQALNRFHARRLLIEKFQEKVAQERSKRQREIEKIRRQKRRRSRRAQEKILADKHHLSAKKETRRKNPLSF